MTMMTTTMTTRARALTLGLLAALAAAGAPRGAGAQWVTTHEQFYLQAPHNWEFRNHYQGADRLFNAFDYGHAILYEVLWTRPNAPASALEEKEYEYLTKKVLVRPPRVPLEEAAIEIRYAQLAPEAKQMFEWAHILHRQIYDVLAYDRLSPAQKDAEVARLLAYYKSRKDLAFSSRPKSMALMQEQPYSLAFRQQYPKFNGLIWAYHWLQVGLYEPLLVGRTDDERQAGVRATVARFWQMLGDPPRTFPHQMPMTAAVAPEFARRYPEAAIIFDNLHSMHDVISDVLANDSVPRGRKRAEIMLAARRYRDDTSFVMAGEEAWRTMSRHMGVENMGGPSVNFLPALPTPTVSYGAVMRHDDRTGEMLGVSYGQLLGAHGAHGAGGARPAAAPADSAPAAHAAHGAEQADTAHARAPDTTAATPHGAAHDARRAMRPGTGPGQPLRDSAAGHGGAMRGGAMHGEAMMELHRRMMADSVIRRRVMADTAMRRTMHEMMQSMPSHGAEHEAHMRMMEREAAADSSAAARPAAKRARAPRRAAAPAKKPAPKPADPHAGHTP